MEPNGIRLDIFRIVRALLWTVTGLYLFGYGLVAGVHQREIDAGPAVSSSFHYTGRWAVALGFFVASFGAGLTFYGVQVWRDQD